MKRFRFLAAALVAVCVVGALTSGGVLAKMENASAIRGRVVELQTRQPLAGVRAAVFTLHGIKELATAFSNRDGSFKLDGLTPGSFRLELTKSGFRGLAIEGITVRANEVMIIAGPIGMSPGQETPQSVARAQFNNRCGVLVQPGVTADVYVVCGQTR